MLVGVFGVVVRCGGDAVGTSFGGNPPGCVQVVVSSGGTFHIFCIA